MFEDAVEIRDRLAVLVDRLDPDAFSGQSARQLWAVLDASERLCAAGKTLLARRVAATHRPNQQGTKTAAEDLARKAGTSTGAARDSVDTSARLPEQPVVDQALRRGELSPAQVALISAAVAANPAEEARLVELAPRVSLAELREECARVRAAADPDPEATNRRLHAARQLRRWIDGEGFWILHAKGTPQAGAAFNTAIQPIIDQRFNNARADGRREPLEAYAFDALIHLVEHATGRCDCHQLSADPTDTDDGGTGDLPTGATAPTSEAADPAGDHSGGGIPVPDAGESSAAGEQTGDGPRAATRPAGGLLPATAGPARDPASFASRPGPVSSCGVRARQTVNPRYLALLRVDVQALRSGHVVGGERCEIGGVGPVPVTVARELLGEAILKLVITDGVDVLNVTHLGRGPTAAQRAALLWMNPTCSVQGCPRSRLEWDHREPWAQTRHTRLDELDGLCAFHHDLKTRCGYALVAGAGKRAFVPPDDPRHPRHRKPRDDASGQTRPPRPAAARSADRRTRRRRRSEQQAFPDIPAPPGSG